MKKHAGISLLEILVSLFLASIIMTLIINIYLDSKCQYIEAEKILATEFDVQWVTDLLSDSIRRAGFTPCLGIDQLQIVDRRSSQKLIHALQFENEPRQLIQVTRMNEYFSKIIQVKDRTKISITHSKVFHAKHPVLIADCKHAEIHDLISIEQQLNETIITLSKPLIFSYDTSAYIGEFLEEYWFIKKNAKGDDTLHYRLFQTEEVTPLIHSLKTNNRRGRNKQFLEVLLGLGEKKTHQLLIAVRGL